MLQNQLDNNAQLPAQQLRQQRGAYGGGGAGLLSVAGDAGALRLCNAGKGVNP